MDNETAKTLITFAAGIIAGVCGFGIWSLWYVRRYPHAVCEVMAYYQAARGLCRRHAHEELDRYFTEALEDGVGEGKPCPYLDGENDDDAD